MRLGMFSLSAAVFLASAVTFAQTDSSTEKSVSIPRIEEAPVIDGALDEVLWEKAVVITDLHQVVPTEYSEPSQRTEFLLAYDDDYLYVGARMYETDPGLIEAKVLRQGEGLRVDDRIRVILDPFNDNRSGYQFQTNANSVRFDGIYKGEQNDFNWDGIWLGASEVTDFGWVTEVAIPFKTLSFNEDSDWGLNLVREVVRDNERIAWSSRNRSTNPSASGTLNGIRGVSQGKGLDIVPSLSVQNFNDRVLDEKETEVEPSLDIYYKITSALNGSLTFNTDFSATEVDNRQVDLSRFSQFFPEKRSFFLRESDIFEFGGIGSDEDGTLSQADRENARPYFSRQIGLSDSGEPVGLDAGAKITGRIGKWDVGAIGIIQEEFEDVDSTNIFVGRLAANILQESSVGMIVTQGDPKSNLDNSLFGADFRYSNSRLPGGNRLDANFWFQRSDTEGISGDDSAFGLIASFPSATGWRGGISAKEVQENFNPALGFVRRSGVRQYANDVGYTHRFTNHYIDSLFVGVDTHRVDVIDGDLQSQSILLRLLELENSKGDELQLRHNIQKESLVAPDEISEGIFIPAGEYSFSDTEITLGTARSRPFRIELSLLNGDYYTGTINSAEAEIDWLPSKHFSGSFSYEVSFVDLPEGEFDTRLISANLATVFSNTLSWVNLIQFDNVSNNLGIDSRLHWTPQAGRNVYFVVSQGFNRDEMDDRFHSTETDLTFKVDYTFRF